MTWHIAHRLRHARSLENVVLAVPDGPRDEALRHMAQTESIPCFAGSEVDLVDRLLSAAIRFGGDPVVRVTGDCPLVDPALIDQLVDIYAEREGELDYVSNVRPPTFPHGLDAEVYSRATLHRLSQEIQDPLYREWFPLYLWEHEDEYRTYNLKYPTDLSHLRWTVDYPEDLTFVREVYRVLSTPDRIFGMDDVLGLLEARPDLSQINAHHHRGENYPGAMAHD